MASSGLMKLACIVAIMSMIAFETEAAMTCGTVTQKLAPCLMYLRNGGRPTAGCCNGIGALNNMARSTPDRQAACNCLKSAATTVSGINMKNAAALPGQCRVNIGYPISTTVDCSRVH